MLVLEANPDLSWRDIQHLVVQTALKNEPDSPSWSTVNLFSVVLSQRLSK